MRACFDEQDMVYDEKDGTYTPKEPYVTDPDV
jgi:hypothetical protein